ncbi:hypothetical protein BJX63DRAFT_422019 [Aspergillus granulosus]|uniref:Uncharacterized protein n=1 Tax=Aspergillus granulosus TaxID=176169 RepID=A0ABR4HB02_9EURO
MNTEEAAMDEPVALRAHQTFLVLGCGPIGVLHTEKDAEILKEQFDMGDGFDIILECSGAESCMGMGNETITFAITVVCVRGLVIKGSIQYLPGCHLVAIDILSRGMIDIKRPITNRYNFEEPEGAFTLIKTGRQNIFKVMIAVVRDKD